MLRKLFVPTLVCILLFGIGAVVVHAEGMRTYPYPSTTTPVASATPTATPEPHLTDPYADFMKQIQQQITDGRKKIDTTRKACAAQLKAFYLTRLQQRKALVTSCKPIQFTGEPATKDEAASRSAQQRATLLACRQQIIAFDKETKTQVKALNLSCWQQQRSVLGLSTTIPYNATP